jgi:hypothetical protein
MMPGQERKLLRPRQSGTAEASSEDAQSLALAVGGSESIELPLSAWVFAQEEDGVLTEGPFEVSIADLGTGGT